MTIEVELTSHTKWGHQELFTFVCRYPRKIHAQVLTHRAFSRNAQSSRAMRISTMMEQVRQDPACIEMRKHGKGMQPDPKPPTESQIEKVKRAWDMHYEATLDFVNTLDDLDWAKEEANRFLEPFAHITTIITATREGLKHFFGLRRMEAGAQAAIDQLALQMREAMEASEPRVSRIHVPYPSIGWAKPSQIAQQLTAGARVSFGKDARDLLADENVKLAERLWSANPRHASPMEHVVVIQPMLRLSRPCNFGVTGYLQMRHLPDDWDLRQACQWVIEERQFEQELRTLPRLDLGPGAWSRKVRILNEEEFYAKVEVAQTRHEKGTQELTFTDPGFTGRVEDGWEWWTIGPGGVGYRTKIWRAEDIMPIYPAQTLVHMLHVLTDEEFAEASEWLRRLANAILMETWRDQPMGLMQQLAFYQDTTMASLSMPAVADERFRQRLQEVGLYTGGFWTKWSTRELTSNWY